MHGGVQAELPSDISDFVRKSTANYGKVKLVLQRNKFFVESPSPAILKQLLQVGHPLIWPGQKQCSTAHMPSGVLTCTMFI